jgi:hypothetical protein
MSLTEIHGGILGVRDGEDLTVTPTEAQDLKGDHMYIGCVNTLV